MKRILVTVLAVSGLTLSAATASAYTLDTATGDGFVGKGEVQTAFGWNNHALQANADDVSFFVSSTVVESTTWTCTKDNENSGKEIVQQRANTTTTTVQGVLDHVARDKKQITGFLLTGYDGGVVSTVVESDGPRVGTCPAEPSGFVFDDNVETTTAPVGDSGLFVEHGGVAVLLYPSL